jgi:Tfp pilus assembly protein PilV
MQKSRRARLDEARRGGYPIDERGFSLLEALVALTLFTITLLGISGLFLTGMGAAGIAQDSSIAANLARERLDMVLQAPASLPSLDGTSAAARVPVGSGPTFTVLTCVDTSSTSFTDVRVRVSWGEAMEGSKPKYSRQLETQVAAANSGGRASTCP